LFNLKTMNYSTLKKTAALSIVSLMAFGAANAQTSSDAMAPASTSAKIFGGSKQYRTWNVGVNVGVSSAKAPFGTNNFSVWDPNVAYGISVRKQLAHSFGLQLDVTGPGSSVGGERPSPLGNIGSFKTSLQYQATLSGKVNVATVDFLARKNAINFYVSAGGGLVSFNQKVYKDVAGTSLLVDGATRRKTDYGQELVIPVGVGLAFRLSDRIALDLGYTDNFIDGNSFDGVDGYGDYSRKNKWTYAYAGLDFSLGSAAKPNLDWVNPIAMMYDELNDPTLKQEVEALKGRVTNVEKAVDDLKKDSDGDGVSDQFDKCPGTPAGTVVDGSGCPLKMPAPMDTSMFMRKGAMGDGGSKMMGTAYSNIQFEFDSSVLRTSSYPVLDATSADLRSSGKTIWVNGYASSEGTAAHNMALSKDRANSVKTYLVNSGVDAKHIKVKGYGETHPIADNSTEDGRVLNRRVQFKK
jgi:OOP family OmpA-OmpF porin